MMVPRPARLSLVLQGDRLIVASVRGSRLETFAIEAEQPSAALRAELDARKIATRAVAIALPRAAVTVKPIELPEVGELEDMVRFELERHVPFPADDAPFAFVPVAPDPAAPPATGGRRVLIVAADRRVVDGAVRIAQEAGLRPTSVTVSSHDLIDLVRPARGRRVAWVHRVGADVELLLVQGAGLALSRHVPAADDETVAAEVRRSLAVVRWRGVDEVWMSGDGDGAATASTSPFAELGAPVSLPPYTKRAEQLLDSLSPDDEGAAHLATAAAAGRRVRALDLIPLPLRPRRLTRPQLVTIGIGAAAVVLAVGALIIPGFRDRSRLAALDADIKRLAPEMREVETVQKELERKRALLGTIETLESNAVKPLPVLRELTDLLPNDAWLTLLSIDSKGAELTGQAAAASALIPLLENSARFERVEFASPVTRGREREQFRIIARWEPGGATAAPAVVSAPPPAPPTGRNGAAATRTAPPPPATRATPDATAAGRTRPGPAAGGPAVQRAPRPIPPAVEDDVEDEGDAPPPQRRIPSRVERSR
jgi:Tfp pilus assembly protein PilN